MLSLSRLKIKMEDFYLCNLYFVIKSVLHSVDEKPQSTSSFEKRSLNLSEFGISRILFMAISIFS